MDLDLSLDPSWEISAKTSQILEPERNQNQLK
jgi:hypothetical protein